MGRVFDVDNNHVLLMYGEFNNGAKDGLFVMWPASTQSCIIGFTKDNGPFSGKHMIKIEGSKNWRLVDFGLSKEDRQISNPNFAEAAELYMEAFGFSPEMRK